MLIRIPTLVVGAYLALKPTELTIVHTGATDVLCDVPSHELARQYPEFLASIATPMTAAQVPLAEAVEAATLILMNCREAINRAQVHSAVSRIAAARAIANARNPAIL